MRIGTTETTGKIQLYVKNNPISTIYLLNNNQSRLSVSEEKNRK